MMGLDMYLSASKYVSGFTFRKDAERAVFDQVLAAAGFAPSDASAGAPSLQVELNVAYWRKVNAVHAWFVQNVQDGKDACQRSYVEREQLGELLGLCSRVADAWGVGDRSVAERELPPVGGFFFGDTELNDYYIAGVRNTVVQLAVVLGSSSLKEADFYYRASWWRVAGEAGLH